MITDPEVTENRDDWKVIRTGGFETPLIKITSADRAFYDCEDYDQGVRIVMNVIDMKKLMESNHEH